METPNYYAIIPEDVRYDRRLTDKEKLLYGEISALSNTEGCCWASNKDFASLYGVSKKTISTAISKLEKYGYIKREMIYAENSKQILKRRLWLL